MSKSKCKEVLEYCSECDKITPFPDALCYYCGCHSPSGDLYDPDLNGNYWDQWAQGRQVVSYPLKDKKMYFSIIEKN